MTKGLFAIEKMRAVELPLAHDRRPAGILSSAKKDLKVTKGLFAIEKMREVELPLAHERRPAGTLSSVEKDLWGPKGSLPLKTVSCGASTGT